ADAYLELSLYARPSVRHRLVYVTNVGLLRQYTGTDTDALLLNALQRRAPVNVQDYYRFVAANPRFLLIDDPSDEIEGWLFWRLLSSGYRITPLTSGARPILFEVQEENRR